MIRLLFSLKHRVYFSWFVSLVAIASSAYGEEIHLNEPETPEQADVFYIDDLENVGWVTGEPAGKVVRIDAVPEASIAVGDLFTQEQLQGRIRKFFLMFQLPEEAGRKLLQADLNLYLGFRSSEQSGEEVPPLHLFHASDWPAGSWQQDPDFRGLTTSAFSDSELFGEHIVIAEDIPRGPVVVDVTKMLQENYSRNKQPVAVFRIEVAEGETLDIMDEVSHTYNFWGPGQAADKSPERAPTLILTFE